MLSIYSILIVWLIVFLGMGDVVSLVEKVQDVYDEKDTMKAYKKMQSGQFGLDDMLSQMQQLRKLGPLSGIMKMIPGMPKLPKMNDEDSEKKLKINCPLNKYTGKYSISNLNKFENTTESTIIINNGLRIVQSTPSMDFLYFVLMSLAISSLKSGRNF